MSIRSAASWAQPRQVSSVPRGARTGRAPSAVFVMAIVATAYPRRSCQGAAHDRETLVGDGQVEADRFPEAGGRSARRVGPGTDLRVRLDRREATAGQVVADRRDQCLGEAGAARL